MTSSGYRILKIIRVSVSLFFFLLYTFLFIDIAGLFSQEVMNVFTTFQFFPSLLSFVYSHEPETLAGFVFILILAFVFGRVYCSSLCPLGTLQDILLFFRRMFFRRKKFTFRKSMLWLGYSFAFLIFIQLFLGGNFVASSTEPFSLFGKLMLGLASPVYVSSNNMLAGWFSESGSYLFVLFDARAFSLSLFLFALLFLLFFSVLNYIAGRFWCASVCPAGSALALASRFSFYQIRIKKDLCNRCNSCVRVCKAGCIDTKNYAVDMKRCVLCFNCTTACPQNGITYSQRKIQQEVPAVLSQKGDLRRDFLLSGSVAAIGVSGTFLSRNTMKNRITEKRSPVSPPGSLGVQRFSDCCTACGLCISRCPTGVLQPSFLEYGPAGMMIPKMDFTKNFCNYECSLCSQICPTRALLALDITEKKRTQIGIALFEKSLCVVVTEGTDCGACAEHCPTGAIEMIAYKNSLVIPSVTAKFCVGCGACEHACPVRPLRSIRVKANEHHQTAELQESNPENNKIDYKSDFPF